MKKNIKDIWVYSVIGRDSSGVIYYLSAACRALSEYEALECGINDFNERINKGIITHSGVFKLDLEKLNESNG